MTVVSNNDKILLFVVEEKLSGPEKVVMFHRSEKHSFLSDLLEA